jgi:hypothetical protein
MVQFFDETWLKINADALAPNAMPVFPALAAGLTN